ncbi:uncharacterized protein LOC134298378 [Anolis carolinensis]|uniref:uncharacterized protein LOC134298378 n=1 Tax=Anolis carolinensis TaxID=28377 RepID=UPI002F2B8622
MNFGTWNVRTLLDNTDSERPERRTAIIARKLGRFKIDIAALQETQRAGEGQLKEEKGGYIFFWKGLPEEERRIHGVGFAIRNDLVKHLTEAPTGISERLSTLRNNLAKNQQATIICTYAPTLDADEDIKENFYCQLDTILSEIPKEDKIILLGDFNARVGRDSDLWPGIIGKYGVGNSNSNGILLLTKCGEHNLVITNTLFHQKNKLKISWKHPRSKHWHLLDYVIARARDRRDVLLTRAMTGADDCWTDHRLIQSTMAIKIVPQCRLQGRKTRRKMNTQALLEPSKRALLQTTLKDHLPTEHPENVEEHWNKLKTSIITACEETIGYQTKKHQDWFDDNDKEIQQLIDSKRKAFHTWQRDTNCAAKKKIYASAKAEVQRRTRELKNIWWTKKAEEIQHLADTHDSQGFFKATKIIYGPRNHRSSLRSSDGPTVLKDKTSIAPHWEEHYQNLLNRSSNVAEETLSQILQQQTRDELAALPSLEEVSNAISQQKNNKASGPDGIPAEIFKEGGPELIQQLHQLIEKVWMTEKIPADFKDATIITLFKKGDRTHCGNYRGISLLTFARKILTRILANRLLPVSEDTLPESQNGFRPSRGTVNMIFTARQLQEKCREQNQPLYMAFIDLAKAFDTLNRSALWTILQKIGCPDKFVNILRLLHDDMMATVLDSNSSQSDPFKVGSGVKQGCVIAATLFSIFIAMILHLVDGKLPTGVEIFYRTDVKLFNLSRLKAKTKVTTTSVIELQYAEDNVVCAHSEEDLQATLNTFAEAYEKLGLSLNIVKTKVLFQQAPANLSAKPGIQLNGVTLENVDNFRYLGSHLSTKVNIDTEIQHRLSSASASFFRMKQRVFDDRDIRRDTKVLVYKAIVLPTLLYACETWTVYRRHTKFLEHFHQRCLRKILQISWEDRQTNVSVLEEAKTTSIEAMLLRHQLRWTGHVVRMPDHRLPKQLLYSELKNGKRNVGGQEKRFKDGFKANLKNCGIDTENLKALALERSNWRLAVTSSAAAFEEAQAEGLREKCAKRKERQANPDWDRLPPGNRCPHCGRICGSRIGLFSHLRTHPEDTKDGRQLSSSYEGSPK